MTKYTNIPPSIDFSGELHSLKQEIESLDSSGSWEFLKRSSNPYELVFSQSQDMRIPQSICSLRPLSRSFFKMVEILSVLQFFERHQLNIKSAHVCEGPGGFIEALLHLSVKNSANLEDAWAITLKPTKSNIPGWKRAYHFLRKSHMVHIEYGADDTGDILVPQNQAAFLQKTDQMCNIFTADGGFDFSEHYSTQEGEVFPLLVSSALIGLQSIQKGGDFVLKIFDMELETTCQFIATLAYCFDEWTLYKPALSRPCNAERYFLGRGFRGAPEWLILLLSSIRDSYAKGNVYITSIFSSIQDPVGRDIRELKEEFLQQQIGALKYAIAHKEEWNMNPQAIWKRIHENSVQWCSEFQIPMKTFTHSTGASHTN